MLRYTKWNAEPERNHQKHRNNVVGVVLPTEITCEINFHPVFKDDHIFFYFNAAFTSKINLSLDRTHSIQPVFRPRSNDGFSVLASHFASSMLQIKLPLTFIGEPILCVLAVAMSEVVLPFSFIGIIV